MRDRVRVLVVDDSALMRKLISTILARDSDIEVVGTAMDGAFALKKIEELRPDVITLDLEMPRLDGIDTLRQIMRREPLPVIVFSTHSKEGAYSTFKALALGATDFVAKPKDAAAGHLDAIAVELIDKIKVAKQISGRQMPQGLDFDAPPVRKKPARAAIAPNRVIAIGVSTGGPMALQYMLSQIPGDFPATMVVVQHMPEGFTEMFARRLDECCAVDVREAKSGDLLIAGRVLICPGNRHMLVRRMARGDIAVLTDTLPVNGHRPSVDVLFHSVGQQFSVVGAGVLMTGMGEDGADGLRAIQAAGGMTIAQSEDSCVVSGMPRAAIVRGYANKIVPLDSMGSFLVTHFGAEIPASKQDRTADRSNRSESKKNQGDERTSISSRRS